ncbi:hypothetical protein SDC9_157430 [bioreactor metagenome]|uniref:Uncharacterized protein n=1 Tax=bioreactor metagenome TaxID=1076179 RepID=A0A645F6Y2_9ZZZZ
MDTLAILTLSLTSMFSTLILAVTMDTGVLVLMMMVFSSVVDTCQLPLQWMTVEETKGGIKSILDVPSRYRVSVDHAAW